MFLFGKKLLIIQNYSKKGTRFVYNSTRDMVLFYSVLCIVLYYPTLLPRVQILCETSTNNRYLYSSHSSRPREVQNLGKSEFWEKKSLDNKSLIRRFGV